MENQVLNEDIVLPKKNYLKDNSARRCVIVGGAEIKDYEFVRSFLLPSDYAIYCDSGLLHLNGLGISPSLIVGDFDSHEKPNLDVETIVLPCEKDDTDTAFAVKEAIKRGFDSFLLVGVIGGRFDHTFANISLLLMLDGEKKKAKLIDDYSVMQIVSEEPIKIVDKCEYFSLLSISGTASGVTIKNAKYPIENATINCDFQYGVSNELLPSHVAEVSVQDGKLLLVLIYRNKL